ncbi:MAG TPA: alkylphosphonate utilization protein [Sulfurovum sp.]|nr:alkylphosphonate utilization protein [Sulfurovum sp.]HIM94711.1 alkylphosphonate utilization protein [Campylobacterales bacterium]
MSKICDLCGSEDELSAYEVAPKSDTITICKTCASSIDEPSSDVNHWHCLSDSMWSENPAVQVMAYRLLTKLGSQDLLDMMYLEPEVEAWAKEGIKVAIEPTRDANGTILNEGDSVSIIKDLVVKGAGFTAKQGTTVKNIRMVQDDPTHIQGKVNGTTIFIISAFLKKL